MKVTFSGTPHPDMIWKEEFDRKTSCFLVQAPEVLLNAFWFGLIMTTRVRAVTVFLSVYSQYVQVVQMCRGGDWRLQSVCVVMMILSDSLVNVFVVKKKPLLCTQGFGSLMMRQHWFSNEMNLIHDLSLRLSFTAESFPWNSSCVLNITTALNIYICLYIFI